jgi:oligopeptidase B
MLPDLYAYLQDINAPETQNFLAAENRRAQSLLCGLEPLPTILYREILGRIPETDHSVPAPFGDFEYYVQMEKAKQYPVFFRQPKTGGAPEVILDCDKLAEGHLVFTLGFWRISPDGSLLAFATDTGGTEVYTLRFKDLRSGTILSEEIGAVGCSSAWATNSQTFFYTKLDDTKRSYQLWQHHVGARRTSDRLVYEEQDARFDISINRSRSGKFLFMTIGSLSTSEVRYCDAANPASEFTQLAHRRQGVKYTLEHQGDTFYIRTNENANNFKLMAAPITNPDRESWIEVVPNRENVVIEGMTGFRNHLVLIERLTGLKRLQIRGATTHFVEFNEPVYTLFLDQNEEYDTELLRFSYTSLVTPLSVYDYDMSKRSRILRKRASVLGYDASQFTSERLFAGKVPISIVYRKGLRKDGKNPLVLYAYGAYGAITEPFFSAERISLLDRGFIFAIAHVRGSGDLGSEWHSDGKLLNKRNSFSDFIACIVKLINLNYTSASKLAITGQSAGGLLVAAVTNMRPELAKVVVANVPFVDVLNAMLDPNLPLTTTEYDEWGDPREAKFYDYIKSYSPYENVDRKPCPSILVTAGVNDSRVPYWGPAKWVAKLRDCVTGSPVILLRTNMVAGHGGASGRERLWDKACEYAFILSQLSR